MITANKASPAMADMTMRTIYAYAIFIGSASLLSDCARPYYVAQPAPVYYPLQSAAPYYPPQRVDIYPEQQRPAVYPDRERTNSPTSRRAHHPAGEESQAAGQTERHQGAPNDSGWVDPEP